MSKAQQVLIVDPVDEHLSSITKYLKDEGFDVLATSSGEECIHLAELNRPELLILDADTKGINATEVIARLKSDPDTCSINVILTSAERGHGAHWKAIESGACFFLPKPYSSQVLQEVIEEQFKERKTPKDLYEFSGSALTCYAKMWGTRGSIPVAGGAYARYGGNTPCLEIRDNDEVLVIDAGSGIRQLGEELTQRNTKCIHLMVGHTHWDHILGFPFFSPVYDPETEIHIYTPENFGVSLETILKGMLEDDFFPVRLEEMQAKFHFHTLKNGEPLVVGNTKVHYTSANHPGPTLAFKIETPTRCIGYVTDNEFLLGYQDDPALIEANHPALLPHREFVSFFDGCKTMVHEAQYTPAEYLQKAGWGHSSVPCAAVLMKLIGAEEWIVTHHDPSHNDEFLENKVSLHRRLMRELELPTRVRMAYDGMVLEL